MDVIGRALARFKNEQSNWSEIYTKAREDLDFLGDDVSAQWNAQDFNERIKTGRPVLTIDQLSQFVHQVANDIRMNTPSINVIPDDKEADLETADVFKGIIRTIEYKSSADDVYDTAATNAVKCSVGFIRVDHEYCDELTFEQDLVIKRVINPLAVYIDSASIECDGRDAKYAFIVEPIRVDQFKKQFPEFSPISFEPDKTQEQFKDDEFINIAEYFEVIEETKEVGLREDGEIEEYTEGGNYRSKRKVTKRKIKRYKLSGADILEETDFPGKYIPIVPVYGEEAWKDGKRNIFSLIRKSKQAQQMFNYWKSLETEIIMKQPNAPVMVPEGAIEDYKEDWLNPAKSMALRYRHMDDKGQPIPPPQRLAPPTMPSGVIGAAQQAVDDIKATMGMYNASLGMRSNEQSGKAIMARQQEGDVATFHFLDNLIRSITQVGRILVCAIPEIYDTPRLIKMFGDEGEIEEVGVNGAIAEGQEMAFDLKKGKYNVRVLTGAPYTTKRQEAAAFFENVVSRQPELMQVMGDLLFKNMDFAGAQEMAARMKKLIDPKLLDENEDIDPEKEQLKQIVEQGKGMVMQMQQEMAGLQEQLNNKQMDLQVKAVSEQTKAQLDREKNQLEANKAQLDFQIKTQELKIKEAELALKAKELEIKTAQTNRQQEIDVLGIRQAQAMPQEFGNQAE